MIKLPGKGKTGMPARQGERQTGNPSGGFALLQEGERRIAAVEAQARARANLQSVVSAVERDIDADPLSADPEALGTHYTKSVGQVRDELVKTVPDTAEQDGFIRRFGDHAIRRLGPLIEKLTLAKRTQAKARLDTLLGEIADVLSHEDDGEEMGRLVQDGLGAIDAFSGALTVEERTALKKGFHRKLAEAEYTRLLVDDPREAYKALDRGAFADMDAGLQDQWKRRARHADIARRRDAKRTEAAAERAEAEARTKRQIAVFQELSQKIDAGEAGYAEIDAAYGAGDGDLPAGLKGRLVARVEAGIEKNRKMSEAIHRIGSLIAEGGTLSPDHDEDLTLVFDEMVGPCYPNMTTEQGRRVLTFVEQMLRIPSPCLDPLWRCFGTGPLEKAGTCGGFLNRIGQIDGLDLPVPDKLRPSYENFTSMIEAGWSHQEALQVIRSENDSRQTVGQEKEAAIDTPLASLKGETNEIDVEGGGNDENPANDTPSVFETIRQQAEQDLTPDNLPREDLAKQEKENWDEWSVRVIDDLSDPSKTPGESKDTIQRFYGELLKPENDDILAAAVQGVSLDAYMNPRGDPVSGPDAELLEQWLSDNPNMSPADAPHSQSHSLYLAKNGAYYRTSPETSSHIGRHARLLLGEIKTFENAANVDTGEYLNVLLAAAGIGFAGSKRAQGRSSKDGIRAHRTGGENQAGYRQGNTGKTAQDSSKNERKGDQGRSEAKYAKRIELLQKDLKTLTGRDKTKVLSKIKKMKKIAGKKRKGEEHSRTGKQGKRR